MSKTATNMMSGIRRAVFKGGLKLEANNDKPKSSEETEEQSESPKESPRASPRGSPSEPQRPRTKEDEEIYVHTARLKEVEPPFSRRSNSRRSNSTKSLPKAHKVYYTEPEETPSVEPEEPTTMPDHQQQPSPASPTGQNSIHISPLIAAIDEILDRMNLGGLVKLLKSLGGRLTHFIITSQYVSTEWNGQLHLQSFGLGIGTFVGLLFLYPYFGKYFEQWVEVFGSLFKHLSVLGIGVLLVSYISNPKTLEGKNRNKSVDGDEEDDDEDQRGGRVEHKYTELEYSVKSSESTRPPSPTKSRARRLLPRRDTEPSIMTTRRQSHSGGGATTAYGQTDAQMLISMTEEKQFLERARQDNMNSKVRDPYDKFMSGAIKEEGKREKYTHFVHEATKKDDERQKYKKFVGATRDQIMRKRD